MERYKSVIVVNISVFLVMLGVGMSVALLPQKIMSFSNSVSSVGYLAAAFALPYVLLQIPIGRLSDKFGFKSFLVGGYFLCALTGLLYYFAKTPSLIYLGRIIHGIGEVPIWALAPALLSIQYPDQKGRYIGIYNASLHCGLTTGSLLGILIYQTWQEGEAFLLFSGLSFLGGLFIALFVKNPPQEPAKNISIKKTESITFLLNSRIIQVVLVGIVLYGAGYGIFMTIIPAFLISAKNCTQTVVGVFFTLFYIALSLSQLIAGPLSDYKGRKPAMICGLMMAAIGLAIFLEFRQSLLIGLLTLTAVGLGVFCVSAMSFLNDSVPRSLKGTVSGAFYFAWGAGYFCGPLLFGKLGDSGNLKIGFLFLSGFFILEIIALSLVIKAKSIFLNLERTVK